MEAAEVNGPSWPESLDDMVRRARFGREPSFWAGADAVVGASLDPETLHFLAVVGLTEIVTQTDRIERDPTQLCAGDELVISRYPKFKAEIYEGRGRAVEDDDET